MKCPSCDSVLMMTDRRGVEIDYCPSCRGVWLDRGELDKLLAMSSSDASSGDRNDRDSDYDDDDRRPSHREYSDKRPYPQKGSRGGASSSTLISDRNRLSSADNRVIFANEGCIEWTHCKAIAGTS
jgi:uncharacterized protein